MLVAFEGIDACGKTTLASALTAELRRRGLRADVLDKKTLEYSHPFVREQMQRTRDTIWPVANAEPESDVLGTHFYLYQLAAWFSVLGRYHGRSAIDSNAVYVADGWFYRVIVKAVLRGNLDHDWVQSLFETVTVPTAVVMVDVDPATAWTRRSTFKASELGRWDVVQANARHSFNVYQGRVRDGLLRLARDNNWLIVCPERDETVDETIAKLIRRLPNIAGSCEARRAFESSMDDSMLAAGGGR